MICLRIWRLQGSIIGFQSFLIFFLCKVFVSHFLDFVWFCFNSLQKGICHLQAIHTTYILMSWFITRLRVALRARETSDICKQPSCIKKHLKHSSGLYGWYNFGRLQHSCQKPFLYPLLPDLKTWPKESWKSFPNLGLLLWIIRERWGEKCIWHWQAVVIWDHIRRMEAIFMVYSG